MCVAYIIVRAYWYKNKAPWFLLLVFLGVIVFNGSITIENSFRIGTIWPVLLCLLYLKRRDLKDYFIQGKNLFPSLLLGLLSGLLLLLLSIILSRMKIVIIEPFPDIPALEFPLRFIEVVIREEILFRSFILGELKRQGVSDRISIVSQGILFSLAHVPRYHTVSEVPILILVTILGLIGGYITNKNKNIAGAIITHAIFNLVPFFR
jgi:membrane protease YdiL (CAAX protease family)